jgi:hypothetical protein
MPFDSNPFAVLFDAWVLQSVIASRYLAKLYRGLRDDQQAAAAIRAGQPATEWLERHGLQTHIMEAIQTFERDHPEETEAEALAWQNLIEGQAGQCLFFAMQAAKDGRMVTSMQGQRLAANRAFSQALTSYHAAFPDEMVTLGTDRALLQAAFRGAEAMSRIARNLTGDERTRFRRDTQAKFISVLREQAAPVLTRHEESCEMEQNPA